MGKKQIDPYFVLCCNAQKKLKLESVENKMHANNAP